jgi:hypothetical protein
VTPFPVIILNIVMDQGKVMYQFKGGSRRQSPVILSTCNFAGKQA